METNKPLARAGYLVAALLVIAPLFDATMHAFPLLISDEKWRFQFIGTLSNMTLVPLLGLFAALAIAVFVGNPRIRRFIGWLCALLAIAVAALTVLFILDYFRVRTAFPPRFQTAASFASATAAVQLILTVVMLALLSIAGLTGPSVPATEHRVRTGESGQSPLISVGRARVAPVE